MMVPTTLDSYTEGTLSYRSRLLNFIIGPCGELFYYQLQITYDYARCEALAALTLFAMCIWSLRSVGRNP